MTGQGGAVAPPPLTNPRVERLRPLNEIMRGTRTATDEEIRRLFVTLLKDSDPWVRRQILESASGVLLFGSLPVGRGVSPEAFARMRAVVLTLGPELDAALADDDPDVRAKAIGTVWVHLTGGRSLTADVPEAFAKRLASIFASDPSASVRTAALQAITTAYRSENAEVRRLSGQVVVAALTQSDPYLLQAAGHAAGLAKLPEALPLLIGQLKHPSFIARTGIAQGIAGYGALARPYLAELQAALEAETDDIARKTIAGTISVISR